MISIDPQEAVGLGPQFIRDNAIHWPVAIDPTGMVGAQYQITDIPFHSQGRYLVDGTSGNVVN